MKTPTTNDISKVNIFGKDVDKVEKYKWKTRGERGTFLEIPKEQLFIDRTYQRKPVSESSILTIARDWGWHDCGALTVALRDSVFYVMDGQHRLLAAQRRSDIATLPCMVYEVEDVMSEAQAFIDTNTHRNTVRSIDKFRASLVAGDELSRFVDGIIRGNGVNVESSGSRNCIACVSACLTMAKESRDRFRAIFPLLVSMHQDSEIFRNVAKGVFNAEKHRERLGKSLLKEPWYSKLIRAGGKACNAEINRLALERGKNGEAVMRDGIEAILRKKI